MGIDQFRPPADLEPEEPAILLQLWSFTSAKYQLGFGHDFKATTILVGGDSTNPGVLARGRQFELTLAVNNAANRFTHVTEPFQHAWAK